MQKLWRLLKAVCTRSPAAGVRSLRRGPPWRGPPRRFDEESASEARVGGWRRRLRRRRTQLSGRRVGGGSVGVVGGVGESGRDGGVGASDDDWDDDEAAGGLERCDDLLRAKNAGGRLALAQERSVPWGGAYM